MRHYPFHVGDYRSATTHLSDSEDLTYRRLLDFYYDTEQPIPTDLHVVARRLRVTQADLQTVLQDFFTETDGAWHHARCDAELEKYQSFKESGKKGADKRWGNDREPMGSLSNPNATPIATKNQEPRTVNQEPEPRTKDSESPLLVLQENQTKSKPLQPAAPAAPKKKVADVESLELQAVCRETWGRYSEAYAVRYGTPPVRNAKISGQVKQFCKRVPACEAPAIAAFYVAHNNAFYVTKGHAVGQLLADAEKLRTEWATNQPITQTQAAQADRTQANGNIWTKIINEAKERERNEGIQQA